MDASQRAKRYRVTSSPDNPANGGVGYNVRLKESDGKMHVGKLHKYRPSDKMHFVLWPDGDGHWTNLSIEKWEWEGLHPAIGQKPAPPREPASHNPVHKTGNLIQMGKPNHLDLNLAETRFDSALHKRAHGDRVKAQQFIDNRTKATKTAEKLNTWWFLLREEDFKESADKALRKLREMGYEGYDAKGRHT